MPTKQVVPDVQTQRLGTSPTSLVRRQRCQLHAVHPVHVLYYYVCPRASAPPLLPCELFRPPQREEVRDERATLRTHSSLQRTMRICISSREASRIRVHYIFIISTATIFYSENITNRRALRHRRESKKSLDTMITLLNGRPRSERESKKCTGSASARSVSPGAAAPPPPPPPPWADLPPHLRALQPRRRQKGPNEKCSVNGRSNEASRGAGFVVEKCLMVNHVVRSSCYESTVASSARPSSPPPPRLCTYAGLSQIFLCRACPRSP